MAGLDVAAAHDITSFAVSRTKAEAERHAAGRIDRALVTDVHAFDLGGRIVEAFYPGPAHTVDNAVVFGRTSGALFCGCMMRSLMLLGSITKGLGNIADADA